MLLFILLGILSFMAYGLVCVLVPEANAQNMISQSASNQLILQSATVNDSSPPTKTTTATAQPVYVVPAGARVVYAGHGQNPPSPRFTQTKIVVYGATTVVLTDTQTQTVCYRPVYSEYAADSLPWSCVPLPERR